MDAKYKGFTVYLWEKLCPASLVSQLLLASQLLLELVIVLFLTVRGNTFPKKIKGDMKKKGIQEKHLGSPLNLKPHP